MSGIGPAAAVRVPVACSPRPEDGGSSFVSLALTLALCRNCAGSRDTTVWPRAECSRRLGLDGEADAPCLGSERPLARLPGKMVLGSLPRQRTWTTHLQERFSTGIRISSRASASEGMKWSSMSSTPMNERLSGSGDELSCRHFHPRAHPWCVIAEPHSVLHSPLSFQGSLTGLTTSLS